MSDEEGQEIGISFPAIFTKAMTSVDGGLRITFEMGENWGSVMQELAQYRGKRLQLIIIAEEDAVTTQ